MSEYVAQGSQLVAEIYVRDIKRSAEFFRTFGFEVIRDDGNFVELRWEQSLLFLEQVSDAPGSEHPTGNIRVMVPNVDDYWELAQRFGARVIRSIDDRYYGLRDFTIGGPDGVSLRFATLLAAE
jgi:catechol 2,3-dioxygenase-like lactoylglutathione lyase family enzyme